MPGHIDWIPWIPTFVALGLGLIVVALACDLAGLGKRLTPQAHAFFAELPRPLLRLWYAAVVVAVALVVLLVMTLTVTPAWMSFLTQLSEILFVPVAVAIIVVIGAGRILHARRIWRARRGSAERGTSDDPAAAAGRALGRLVARVGSAGPPASSPAPAPGEGDLVKPREPDLAAATGRALGRLVGRSPRARMTLARMSRAVAAMRQPDQPKPPPGPTA